MTLLGSRCVRLLEEKILPMPTALLEPKLALAVDSNFTVVQWVMPVTVVSPQAGSLGLQKPSPPTWTNFYMFLLHYCIN